MTVAFAIAVIALVLVHLGGKVLREENDRAPAIAKSSLHADDQELERMNP